MRFPRPKAPLLVVAASIAVVLVAGVAALALQGDDELKVNVAARAARATTTRAAPPSPPLPAPVSTLPPPPEVLGATAPPRYLSSTVALASGPTVAVYPTPGGTQPRQTLENPQPSGAPLVFLVQGQRPEWVEVLLPVRPNGSTGWVQTSQVRLTQHDYDVVVELGAHRMTVFKAGRVIVQEPVGIGMSSTPTPGGVYYIKELLKPPDPNTVYGTYAYGLSGFSNVLTSYEGGDGVIGLHGTNDPAGLGKDVSAGCIRMSNEVIEQLARELPLGTPVEIRS